MASTAWVTIGVADLQDFLNSDQLDVLNAGNLANGQTDRKTGVIAAVVAEMRSDIEGNGGNVLDANTAAVPPSLKATAIWLALNRLALTHSITLKLTDDQKQEVKDAKARMERVRKGEQRVEAPLSSATASLQTSVATAISYNEIQLTREASDGLY